MRPNTMLLVTYILWNFMPSTCKGEGFSNVESDEISVSAGNFHTCAIEARVGDEFGGPVRCWGLRTNGQSSPAHGVYVQLSSGHLHTVLLESTKPWSVGD